MASQIITQEDNDYIRLILLCKVVRNAVIDYFDKIPGLEPKNLNSTLKTKRGDLKRTGVLTPHYRRILYSEDGVKSEDMDVGMLVFLLRNLGNLGQPSGFQWETLPLSIEVEAYHDIARAKFYRNKYFHLARYLENIDFESDWEDISNAVTRLAPSNEVEKYKQEIQKIKCIAFEKLTERQQESTVSLEELAMQLKEHYNEEEFKTLTASMSYDEPFDVTSNRYMDLECTPLELRCTRVINLQPIKRKSETSNPCHKDKKSKLDPQGSNMSRGQDSSHPILIESDDEETPLTNWSERNVHPNTTTEITKLISEAANPELLPVLFEADAGVGKTTLFHRLALDWANNLGDMKQFSFVFLISLRKVKSLRLLDIICDDMKLFNPKLKPNVAKCLQEKNILFLLDGLDEVSLDPENDLAKLISKKGDNVFCSSRPTLVRENMEQQYHGMNNFFLIKLLGFSENTLVNFVQEYFENKPEKDANTEEIINLCKNHLFCKALLRIPLYVNLICYLKKRNNNIPETATQLFNTFLHEVIINYLVKCTSTKEIKRFQYSPLEGVVPAAIRRLMKAIAELAYKTLIKKEVVFSEKHVKDCHLSKEDIIQIGLFTLEDNGEMIHFRHKLFHEYFAGLYLTLHEAELYSLFTSSSDAILDRSHILQNAFFFGAGLSKDFFQSIVFCLNSFFHENTENEKRHSFDVKNINTCENCSKLATSILCPLTPKKAVTLSEKETNLSVITFFIQLLFESNDLSHSHESLKNLSVIPVHCSSAHSLASAAKLLGASSSTNSKRRNEGMEQQRSNRMHDTNTNQSNARSLILIDGPNSDVEQIICILKECSEREYIKYITLFKAEKYLIDEMLNMTWRNVEKIGFQECAKMVPIENLLCHFPNLKVVFYDRLTVKCGKMIQKEKVDMKQTAIDLQIPYRKTVAQVSEKLKKTVQCRYWSTMHGAYRRDNIKRHITIVIEEYIHLQESKQSYLVPKSGADICYCHHDQDKYEDAMDVEDSIESRNDTRLEHRYYGNTFNDMQKWVVKCLVFISDGILYIRGQNCFKSESRETLLKKCAARQDVTAIVLKDTDLITMQKVLKIEWKFIRGVFFNSCKVLVPPNILHSKVPNTQNILYDKESQKAVKFDPVGHYTFDHNEKKLLYVFTFENDNEREDVVYFNKMGHLKCEVCQRNSKLKYISIVIQPKSNGWDYISQIKEFVSKHCTFSNIQGVCLYKMKKNYDQCRNEKEKREFHRVVGGIIDSLTDLKYVHVHDPKTYRPSQYQNKGITFL